LALQNNDSTGNGFANGNTAVGNAAMISNIDAFNNTAMGFRALFLNDATGNDLANNNTAFGSWPLQDNTDGSDNTAVGAFALLNNGSTGNRFASGNTAVGVNALNSNTDGALNTAVGDDALVSNTDGVQNVAIGAEALFDNQGGSGNIAVGVAAGRNITTGGNNVTVGTGAGNNIVAGNNNTYIGGGVNGLADENNTIRIGLPPNAPGPPATQCFLGGVVVGMGNNLLIDATTGQLFRTASSARYKEEIRPMDKASESLFALKPVAFRYKKEFDANGTPLFGLVAEEVAKVNPDLVILDRDGKPDSVRYEGVNAMLLNEFLKEHKKVEEQQSKIDSQQASIAELKNEVQTVVAQLKEQAAQIQKVSAQLEMGKPAPQVVVNEP